MSKFKRWMILVIVSSALLLIVMDMTILYTALPSLTHDLGASASEKLWILNGYSLSWRVFFLQWEHSGTVLVIKNIYPGLARLFCCFSCCCLFSSTGCTSHEQNSSSRRCIHDDASDIVDYQSYV